MLHTSRPACITECSSAEQAGKCCQSTKHTQQQRKSSLWELLRPQQLAASVQEGHLRQHGSKLTACVPTEMRKVTDP